MKTKPIGVSVYRMPRTEQVYTFKNETTGLLHHFAVDQMNAYIRAIGLEVRPIIIHQELLDHLIRRGGWQQDHLDRLPDQALDTPCTLIEYDTDTHVLADGVHRVLRRAMKGLQTFPAYVVPEKIWRRFLIYDFPSDMVDWSDFLANGDRHEGLTPKHLKRVSW